ncbi:kelch repeat-containing protein [uncultured Tenacibaculum sp.]|uniref:Kelch repeat-containing protein n=1 Tax=uncultured Tenacibaculum sp. TaxID=174713 RepID=UPI00262793DE|nr:kelch repeat-containing protein [uncultured Tenacibaculum sp.]
MKLKLYLLLITFLLIISCSDDKEIVPNLPPNNFILVNLPNNSTDIKLSPTLSWGRANDPEGEKVTYSVLLDYESDNLNKILISDISETSFSITETLDYNRKYYWQVIAKDERGNITKSEVYNFTTRNNLPPSSFVLNEIKNNESNVILKPNFSWEKSIDPDNDNITYTVLLDKGNENPTSVISSNLTTNSFQIIDDLDFNTIYSWKVIASDQNGNTTESNIFSFRTRNFIGKVVTQNAEFSTRTEHSVVKFNQKFWVIGGYHASNNSVNGGLLNDVWSSSDGVNWNLEVANNMNSSFSPRTNHTSVVFNNKVWIIGGGGINSILNDVWSSSDGINWNLETNNATFPARQGHTTVVFNNKIWIIGGKNNNSEFNDIWSSSDGLNWNLETNNAAFVARFEHTSIIFKNKIWVIGGINSNQGNGLGDLNDVWSSSDGINWKIENINSNFSPRHGHSSTVFKNRMWVISGSLNNDFWSSKDGIIWEKETEITNFNGRGNHANIVYDNKLWILGGWEGSLLNDIWHIY